MARDGTREDSHKLHKRWLRHQAFMAELAQNKEWLEKIERVRKMNGPLPSRRHTLTSDPSLSSLWAGHPSTASNLSGVCLLLAR